MESQKRAITERALITNHLIIFRDLFHSPNVTDISVDDFTILVSKPVLTNHHYEVETDIKRLKTGKSKGTDGLGPGVSKSHGGWQCEFTIFKYGNKSLPTNYRSINVMDKLYGCESWMNGDFLKPLIKLYHWGIKQLSVRM